MRRRISALVLFAIAGSLAACGDSEDTITEGSLRDCLADGGLTFQAASETASPGLGNIAPDFQAVLAGGGNVSLVVEGSDEKAQRRAADVRGALQSFGVAGSGDRLIAERNVIAVFDRAPTSQERDVVGACID